MISKEFLQEAKNDETQLIKIRHHLHAHPETGFHLSETKAYVKQTLISMGYEPTECGKSGLIALVGGKKPGKVFLIRADMDALPIKEETNLSFSSKNENMHACGHDMHTTMLLGAAKLLKKHEHEINGTIKFMFQPAEEIFEGSHDMIEHGVLHNPDVDAALMMHVMSGVPIPTGTIITCHGGVSAPAADYFTICIQGKGCHGSMPNNGIDPVTIAAHIILALQEIQTRELSIFDEAILTIGTIQGGNAANAIPDTVTLSGTIRTYDEKIRHYIKQRVTEIANGLAASFRATANVIFGSGCPTLQNDKELASCTLTYVRELLGVQNAFSSNEEKASKSSGSEDFAYVSHQVPSIMLALAAGEPDKGHFYPLHHPKVTFDENVLSVGSAVYAYTAMRWLEEHS